MITVQTSLMPFSTHFTTVGLNNCKTLQDVVKTTVPYNFKDSKLVVTHNGVVIVSDRWESTKLKEHDLVGLNFVPMGGHGGGKNIVTQAIILTVVAVSSYFSMGAAAAAFKAGEFWTGVGYTSLTIGISMAGSMATNALMSVPKQSRGTGSSLAESQTSFIEGARNTIDKYGIIPVNLGTNRMFPKLAASIYTESAGNNQYARQLFTYGYGKVAISDRKFGETEVSNFKEVEFEDRLNADLNQGTGLYANDIYQQDYNVALTHDVGYVLRSTQSDIDEVEIDITFQGLCQYDANGNRGNQAVEFEIQYAPTGTQNWSIGTAGLTRTDTQTLTFDLSAPIIPAHKFGNYIRKNVFIILDTYNGVVYSKEIQYQLKYGVTWPALSNDEIILGYIAGKDINGQMQWVDNHAALVPTYINSVNDFPVNVNFADDSNVIVTIGGGYLKGVAGNLRVVAATAQSLRKTKRIKLPTNGQYDIRIKRLTADSTDDKIIDKAYLTAVKSIKYSNPVRFADISGSAMRIKASDQLSGAVDSYNVIVSTYLKGYNPNTDTWDDDVVSSNPADIFRYVLQSPAFAKHLNDNQIDLDKLAEWWVYCNSLELTYNRIIDYDTSIDDVLNDICAAGVATLSKVDNVYSVIIDNERPIIKGMITPRNSWDYKGNIAYPDIPHALRIEFRNEDTGYETDERIVYADGYDENNAELYERLQFTSCTNADLAYWYGRRYFATALLQPETHTFKMDFEHMTFNRGDRITLVNDVILVGVGQGRIKELLVDDTDDPTQVLGFAIDDELNIPQSINLGVRIRDNNVTQGYQYHLLQAIQGVTNEFMLATPIAYANRPAIGSLCAFVEDSKELDLIITAIKPNKDQSATITAIDYAPARFNPIGVIPEFNSNITISADFYKPYAPVLTSDIQTDETVMIRNSDGSVTSVAVINLLNKNENNVITKIFIKRRDTTEWYVPTTLKKDADQIIVTGLQDGEYYDFDIRYQRQSGLQLVSDSLLVKNVRFIGGSTPPKDVQNFRVTIVNGLGLFEWTPNDDIDISHYKIKFSASTQNVTWDGAQLVMDKIKSASITNIIHKGVYLIKAVDMLGNESVNATTIISTDSGAFKNVVEELIQQPDWNGVKDRTVKEGQFLTLDDGETEGYYYFYPATVDLGEIYECSLTAKFKAVVEKVGSRLRDINEIRDYTNGVRNIRSEDYSNVSDWGIEFQMNLSNDGSTWSGWQTFTASQLNFRVIKFRIYMYSRNVDYVLRVSTAEIVVDMPDRYESGEDIEITDASVGGVVTYNNAFRNIPSVNVTVQDGAVDDRIEFLTKNETGFTIKIFNATLNTYVKRSFDYLAAGYGRAS